MNITRFVSQSTHIVCYATSSSTQTPLPSTKAPPTNTPTQNALSNAAPQGQSHIQANPTQDAPSGSSSASNNGVDGSGSSGGGNNAVSSSDK